jgi:predicted MFS family arabinose efflux permease
VRKLLLLVCGVVFVETAFYAVLTPLLPELTREYGLSKAGAGVLAGSYATGTLVAAIPSGWLVARIGVRRAVAAGLGLIAVSSLMFAFAKSIAMLDITRFAQGVGASACWTGGLGWLVRVAPAERRGALIGSVMGVATVGALFGPVLGGVAHAVGTAEVFVAVAVVSALLMAWAWATPGPAPVGEASLRALWAAVRDRRVAGGMYLMLLPAMLFGTIYVLTPLRLDDLGAGATAIAAAFLGAAALEAVASPVSGRLTDRHGWLLPSSIGVAGGILAMALLPWPASPWLLGVLIVVLTPCVGFLWTPGLSLVGEGAEAVGVEPGYAFSLTNLSWALGLAVGSSGGASLAQAAGDHVPYFVLGALSIVTLGGLWRIAARRRVAVVH